MSLLDRARPTSTTSGSGASWQRAAAGFGYGVLAAFGLALILLVPVVAAWVTDSQGSSTWTDALATVPVLWVLIHRGTVSVPDSGAAATLPLLAVTVGAVLLARYTARQALYRIDERSGSDADEPWWRVPAGFVLGYTLSGAVLALLGWAGQARPNPIFVLPGAALVAAAGMLWALLSARRSGDAPEADAVLAELTERIPVVLRRAWASALWGAAALAGLGVIVVVLAVVTSWNRISQINGELDAGVVGTTVLVVAQLAALPNIMAWAAGWLSGAAVSVGPVSVGHAAITPGVLPMVPALGALPEAGAGPAWAPFTPILVLAVGGFVGWHATRAMTTLSTLTAKVQGATLAAALSGVIVLAVGFVGALGVSGGSMSYVGPHLLTVPLLLLELAVGAAVAAVALHYRRLMR
ncbi:DUF6350 family protein [Dermacoccaceae bacterium W4C1]